MPPLQREWLRLWLSNLEVTLMARPVTHLEPCGVPRLRMNDLPILQRLVLVAMGWQEHYVQHSSLARNLQLRSLKDYFTRKAFWSPVEMYFTVLADHLLDYKHAETLAHGPLCRRAAALRPMQPKLSVRWT